MDLMRFRLRTISVHLIIPVLVLISILLVQLSDELVAAAVANCLRMPGNTPLSLACSALALGLKAENPQVALAQGVRLAQAGRFSEAEPLLRKAYLAQPTDVRAFFWGQALGATGQFEEMAPLFEGGRHAGVKDTPVLFRARYHAARGAWALAQAFYEQAIAEQLAIGSLPDWMRAEAGWLLVRRLRAELDSAMPSDKGYWHYRLGRAYARLSLWEQSIAELQKALMEPDTSSPDCLTELGLAYAAIGNKAKAIETLEVAYQTGDRSPKLVLALASLWREQGLAVGADALKAELYTLGPRYVIDKPTTPGWLLWGYDLGELELEEGPDVTLYLYWRARDPVCAPCVQVEALQVTNLAFDGSFEWPGEFKVSGPQTPHRPGDGCSSFVAPMMRGRKQTNVFFIPRPVEGHRNEITGCYTHQVSVEVGALYLLRGLVAGAGQSYPSFGVIWGATGSMSWFPSQGDDYALQNLVSDWQEAHTITVAPPEATFGFVRLMHRQTAGWVAYDNVLFARIPSEPGGLGQGQ
jgi:tetratricopeptide (TPR) repeat protein